MDCECCTGISSTSVALLVWALIATALVAVKYRTVGPKTKDKQSQSQCTYTSVRGVVNPRFQLVSDYQG